MDGDGGQLASTGKEEKRMPGGRPGGSQLQHSIREGMEGAIGGWQLESERGDGDGGGGGGGSELWKMRD